MSTSITLTKGRASVLLVTTMATLLVVSAGCAHVPKRNPLPQTLVADAQIPDVPRARSWGDEPLPLADEWDTKTKDELKKKYGALFGKPHNYLAISGGGANGAFGAGLLVGWTAAGDRPEFSLVTGISTGALIAPFAFLGSEYDDSLREQYTTTTTKDILKKRGGLNAITSDAASSSKPLQALIERVVTESVMQAIAEEHRKGRRLLIGTTNLDAGRPVIWSIGHIAVSGGPEALALIHQVLLASASIPVAFPPVLVEVEVEGQRYDELHVDGGTTSQVFLYPIGLDFAYVLNKLEVPGTPKVYIIRNSQLAPKWKTTKNKIIPIASRSLPFLIRTQGIGDLYKIFLEAKRDGLDYNLAFIPEDFHAESKEGFDPEYMTKLFNVGYELAKSGYPWKKTPPELSEFPDRASD